MQDFPSNEALEKLKQRYLKELADLNGKNNQIHSPEYKHLISVARAQFEAEENQKRLIQLYKMLHELLQPTIEEGLNYYRALRQSLSEEVWLIVNEVLSTDYDNTKLLSRTILEDMLNNPDFEHQLLHPKVEDTESSDPTVL